MGFPRRSRLLVFIASLLGLAFLWVWWEVAGLGWDRQTGMGAIRGICCVEDVFSKSIA